MEGLDSKNDSIRDRNNSLKRTGGSSRTDYEDTDYVEIKESRSKHEMKKQEESSSTLDKLSSWYKDGEYEKGKSNIKYSDKSFDYDRSRDRDRYLEKNEMDQDKDYVSSEQGRSRRKIWDDTDVIKNMGNYDMGRKNLTDIKNESEREISIPGREDGLEERNDSENRARSRDKSEALEEEKKGCSLIHEEKSEKGKIEQQRSSVSRNNVETREIANFEMEQERGGVSKRKEPEKEGYRDDRYKGRDHEREWEVGHRRFGGRRDTALKTSSNFGVSDVIEIQTKPFETKSAPKDEQAYAQEITKKNVTSGAVLSSEDLSSTRYSEDGPSPRDQNSWRDENEFQDNKNKGQRNNTMLICNFQGSRGGRGRPQPYGPMPMMGSPFGPIGMPPPGQNLSPLNPNLSNLSPSPAGPPMSPNIFMPPFPPPLVWPGARGLDMNLLAFSQNLSPVPPGSSGPRLPFNLGNLNPPNPAFFSNQTGLGRGEALNSMIPSGREQNQDKGSGYEFSSRTIKPPGKAPSRGEQNDYSQNFVDTGMRPQNYIRELESTAVVEDYPRLRELIQKKDEIVANSNTAPMYYKCDLREHVLSPEFFGTKFDVILVDPPWEEYVHRAPGVTDHMEYWTFEEIMNLKIEAISDTPSFIFLWVGDGVGLEQGRQCLKKWGFRRCEDICWVKTNKTNATPGLRHDSHTLFQRSKEHCLMGIKGTVRRSTDGHVIHANIDTDVIIAEEPPYGSTAKPEDMYRIVEHFALGRRRLELFGEDHNIRAGWLTVGNGLSSSNFNAEGYVKNFADKDGKVWQGGGGRNPPPEAPHLVVTTPDIEALRPKSPMKNQLQLQLQQSSSVSVTVVNNTTNNRMPTINQEASSSSFPSPGPWGTSGNMGSDDRNFDMYSYNMNSGQSYEEYREFRSRRVMSLM